MPLWELRKYIEKKHPSTCVPVNLLKIGKSPEAKDECQPVSHIVIDAEWSLNRLYGGYLADYVCGGQWSRMHNFLARLTSNLSKNRVEISVFFDGTSGSRKHWMKKQVAIKKKMISILNHISLNETHPPRHMWVPPNSLQTSLRLVLKHLGINVVVSLDDHKLELMNYVRQCCFVAVMSDDPEFLSFDLPRLFSSGSLKMTYNGQVETVEFLIDEMAKSLALEKTRIPVVSSLLGNRFLSANDLLDFYRRLGVDGNRSGSNFVLIEAVVSFVRALESVDDLEMVSNLVFGGGKAKVKRKFQKSVGYYSLCSHASTAGDVVPNPLLGNTSLSMTAGNISSLETDRHQTLSESLSQSFANKCEVGSSVFVPSFVSDNSLPVLGPDEFVVAANPVTVVNATMAVKAKDSRNSTTSTGTGQSLLLEARPTVSNVILEFIRLQHKSGVMDPNIYRVISTGEYWDCVAFEDAGTELPCLGLFFRPLRQKVYAVLFDYDKLNNEADPLPPMVITEWIWQNSNKFAKAEPVCPRSLGWPVPSVSRLWFGTSIDDDKSRRRAFLSCMHCNNSLMWNPDYVPIRVLVLCSVLRYIVVTADFPVLYKPELDAFLVQAIDPRRAATAVDVPEIDNVELRWLNVRAILLASMLMKGVENAVFANEACGSPIPLEFCIASEYFDGKLFHETLHKAATCRNLLDLCGGRIKDVDMVERMKAAIVEDVETPFHRLSGSRLCTGMQHQKRAFLPLPPGYRDRSSPFLAGDQCAMLPCWLSGMPPYTRK